MAGSSEPDEFRSNLYDYFLNDRRISRFGGNTAIVFGSDRLTYLDLRADVWRWSQTFVDRGLSPGDRIGLLLYNSPEFIACFLAAARIGAVSVPINTYQSSEDIRFIIANSGARLVVAESELVERLGLPAGSGAPDLITIDSAARPFQTGPDSSIPAANPADSPGAASDDGTGSAFILYTSGSTGRPKGVLHRHAAIPYTVETYGRNILKLGPNDRVFSAAKLFFAYGLGNSLSFPLAAGASVILDTARPTPDRLAEMLVQHRPTVFFGVPAIYRALLDFDHSRRLDISSIRLCVSAGEALPGNLFHEWRERFGLTIVDGIGSTEMLHIFISNTDVEAIPDASGRVVPGYEAKLLDDLCDEIFGDGRGNLWVRGDSAFERYWNLPQLTEAAISKDGWVSTGDLYDRRDGVYYHLGRSDDCFKVKGLWVSPIEVETVLLEHVLISEAVVVEAKDDCGLATGKAYLVIKEEVRAELWAGVQPETLVRELSRDLGTKLPSYKIPSVIEIIDAVPRTATGKVQRFKLKSR